MKRLLVLGGSHAETPIIAAARELGLFVATLSGDPSGLAAQMSDQHFSLDYTAHHAITKVVVDERFDALVAGCNDFAAFSVARVAGVIGLTRYDSVWQTEQLHHKNHFRALCRRLDVPVPRSIEVTGDSTSWTNEIQQLRFPLLVKPIDLTGGKGMQKVYSYKEVKSAVENALVTSRQKQVVIEEFVTGQLRSACFFVYGGVPKLLTHADEYMYKDPFLVASALVPSDASKSELNSVTAHVSRICTELQLPDGILHLQYISSSLCAVFVEMCRRPPGDLYITLPTLHPQDSIASRIVKNALGISVDCGSPTEAIPNTLRVCLMVDRDSLGKRWSISPELDKLTKSTVQLEPSKTAYQASPAQKVGITIAQNEYRQPLVEFARFEKQAIVID